MLDKVTRQPSGSRFANWPAAADGEETRTGFLLKKNRQEGDLFPSCKRKVWIIYAQVVDNLFVLEVDVCCSRAAFTCSRRACLS
jgi:hypothetical protein